MDEPQKKKIPAQTVISIEHKGAYKDIGPVYHELHQWARAKKLKAAGEGFTIFLSQPSEFDPSSALFEVCIPVEGNPAADAAVKVKKLPARDVAYSRVTGSYDKIPAHYAEMLAWLDAEGWEIEGNPREVYIKRPGTRGKGDPSGFVTEIQFPIR